MFAKATIFIAFLTAYATALTVPEVAERDEFSSSASMMKRDSYSGDGTWYNTGLSACGTYDNDSQFVVAVSHSMFDTWPGATANPNLNPICGKRARAHYQGRSVDVTVTDKCGGCSVYGDLDFSPVAFRALADPAVGRIHGVTWSFI